MAMYEHCQHAIVGNSKVERGGGFNFFKIDVNGGSENFSKKEGKAEWGSLSRNGGVAILY